MTIQLAVVLGVLTVWVCCMYPFAVMMRYQEMLAIREERQKAAWNQRKEWLEPIGRLWMTAMAVLWPFVIIAWAVYLLVGKMGKLADGISPTRAAEALDRWLSRRRDRKERAVINESVE